MELDEEIKYITTAYEGKISSAKVVSLDKDAGVAKIQLTTLEGVVYDLTFSAQGFLVNGAEGGDMPETVQYETYEALLHTISPKFTDSFNNDLLAKLNSLQQVR